MCEERGICDACGAECVPVKVDMGIGPYEYWGAKGNHVDWQWVSPCCETNVVPGGAKLLSRTTHVARKDHGTRIKAGDRYQRSVWHHWRDGGPGWISVEKRLLERAA